MLKAPFKNIQRQPNLLYIKFQYNPQNVIRKKYCKFYWITQHDVNTKNLKNMLKLRVKQWNLIFAVLFIFIKG